MLVIGNGESRKHISFDNISGVKIGCNAIARDISVDHLVCVDRRMVSEALNNGYKKPIYTREDWIKQFKYSINVKCVPQLPYEGNLRMDHPFQWGSGPYAVLLATKFTKHINLIGFDLYSETPHVNNVYKDTEHYDKSNKHAVDPRYWIYQIAKIFELFPKKKFRIYQKTNWIQPDSWKKKNVSVDNIDNI